MNAIEKLFPVSQQERSFQLKVRRDAGTAAPGWVQPQFVECKKCGRRATRQVWTKSLYVCPNCGVHLPIGAYYRLSTILDHGTFKELNPDLAPNDVLQFPDYQEKLAAASVKTGLKEAAVTATGRIGGVQAVAAVLDSRFFMGSMSTAVGEKITRAIEYAADKRLPLVIFSASGGARMQEGIFSLMQMAKNQCRAGTVQPQRRAVCQCADPPHHRRCHSQFCQPGRHHAGRTGCADRVCRAACD